MHAPPEAVSVTQALLIAILVVASEILEKMRRR